MGSQAARSPKSRNRNSNKKSESIFVFPWEILLVACVLILFVPMYLYLALHLAFAVMPYILLIILFLRSLQFITHNGDTYKNVTQFKHFFRVVMFMALLTVQSSIHLNLISYQDHQYPFPFDLHKLALHQSKKKYILVRYLFSFVAYFLIHDFGIKLAYDGSYLHVLQAITEIIDCTTLFWEDGIISIAVDTPYLFLEQRPKKILAALLKYSKLLKILAPVLIYYDFLILFVEAVRYVLRKISGLWIKWFRSPNHRSTSIIEVIYTLIAKRSISFFFSFLLVYKLCSDCLSCFVSYKCTQAELLPSEDYHRTVERFQKLKELEDSTYKILVVFFMLWIIKTFVLLVWESRTIYDRLRSGILNVSTQLYFLGILDCREESVFNLQAADQTTKVKVANRSLTEQFRELMFQATNVVVDIVQTSSLKSLRGVAGNNRWRKIKRNKIKHDLFGHKQPCDATLYDIQKMAHYIVGAKNDLPDNYISSVLTLVDRNWKESDIGKTLEERISWQNEYKEDGVHFIEELLKIKDDEKSESYWTFLSEHIPIQNNKKNTKQISYKKFRTWVIKAHDNVLSLANTLTSAKEVTDGLDKLVSVILIGATFMVWLKALNYAETSKDFALFASPLFAATFLIKDTLKDLFERIIFVYVIHPFDIGNVLSIDDKKEKMEVAAMGLWTTTFLAMDKDVKRERREAIIYPNSTLAKIKIIKHKMEFDGDNAQKEQDNKSNGRTVK